jgi:hypothetical protein
VRIGVIAHFERDFDQKSKFQKTGFGGCKKEQTFVLNLFFQPYRLIF